MSEQLKRSLVRFGKVAGMSFASSFLTTLVASLQVLPAGSDWRMYLWSPFISAIIGGLAGVSAAVEKYLSWQKQPPLQPS